MHICTRCESELVYPTEWEEVEPLLWRVWLCCPNCGLERVAVEDQEIVEEFDDVLDRGTDDLISTYQRLLAANMREEIERFVAAVDADAILPEDFAFAR